MLSSGRHRGRNVEFWTYVCCSRSIVHTQGSRSLKKVWMRSAAPPRSPPSPSPDKAKAPLGHGGHRSRLPFQVVSSTVRTSLAAPATVQAHQGKSARSARRLASNGGSAGKASSLQSHALSRPVGKVSDGWSHITNNRGCHYNP